MAKSVKLKIGRDGIQEVWHTVPAEEKKEEKNPPFVFSRRMAAATSDLVGSLCTSTLNSGLHQPPFSASSLRVFVYEEGVESTIRRYLLQTGYSIL